LTAFAFEVHCFMLGLFKSSGKKPAEGGDKPAGENWLQKLRTGLRATASRIGGLLSGRRIDEALFEELEDALILADSGVEATRQLMSALRSKAKKDRLETAEQLKSALADLLVELLQPLEVTIDPRQASPFVILMTGVNGAGKTTSIGKLAHYFGDQGSSVLLAAGDTFRAAAREQLAVWGERNDVTVIAQQGGDPAAVIFDAVQAARSRQVDIVLADTAGRLPTQAHLMEELKKVRRVIAKADPSAPHAVWLVLDANTGQNGLTQFNAFHQAVGLTGLILTKLDGSAKGGIIAAIAASQAGRERQVPIAFIGVGEGMDDLRPFVARDFVDALLA
jgi:fused signal recognition particle receptor